MLRVVEHLIHGAGLHQRAAEHHRDAVGQVGDHAHVVGDQQDAGVQLVLQLAQQVKDLGLHRDIQGGGRLVGDDDLRVAGDRHGDHDALALAAGELVRVLLDALARVRDADHLQQLDGAVR